MGDTMTDIGLIAGEIWRFLDDKGGEGTLLEVFASLKTPSHFTLMAVGWLAREGQVFLKEDGADFKLTRKKW